MPSQTTIIRTRRSGDDPYFLATRAAAQDERLTWESRGVLMYLLSKPNDWEVRVSNLQQRCGRDKVYRILGELEQCGYLLREQQRNTDGTLGTAIYQVYETPFTEKPNTAEPEPDEPDTGNQPQHNREKKTKKKKVTEKRESAAGAAKRDYLFDLVAILVFDFKTMALFDALDEKRKKQTGARIGKITAFLRDLYQWDAPIRTEQPPALIQQIKEDVAEFKQWYAIKENKAHIPLDDGKFSTHYLAWYGDNRHRPPPGDTAGVDAPPAPKLKPRSPEKTAYAARIEHADSDRHQQADLADAQERPESPASSPEYRPSLPDGVREMLAEARQKLRHKGS